MRRITIYFLCPILSSYIFSNLSAQSRYTLPQTLQTAKTSNLALKAQKRSIQVGEADVLSSKLRPNPILNNQSLQLMQPAYFPANSNWNDGRNRQVWWQLTKPFLLPGVRDTRIDYANSNLRLHEHYYEEVEQEVLLQAANKWLDVWLTTIRTSVLKQGIDSADLKKSLNVQQDPATEIAIIQSKLQLNKMKTSLENDLTELQLMLGIKEKIEIDTALTSFRNSFYVMNSILADSLSKRPDLLYYQRAVESSALNIKLQKSLALPVPELGVINNPQNTIRYMGIFGTLQIPIFARNQGEIKKAGGLKQQAEDVLSYHKLKASGEVNKAIRDYQLNKDNLQEYSKLLSLSEKLKSKATGAESQEAAKAHLENLTEYYEAQADFLRSWVQLLYVSGHLETLTN